MTLKKILDGTMERRESFLQNLEQIKEKPKIYEILCDPIDNLLREVQKKVEGEDEVIKVIINTKAMEWVKDAEPFSRNLLVNATSSSGKDFVVRNTLDVFPKETWLKRTRITPMALTYWHRADKEPDWTWEGRSLYLEDISDSVLNSDVFKVMASGGSHSTIVINQVAVDIPIRGKPTLFVTTASGNPTAEMLNRFPIVKLNESIDQTEAILKRQAKAAALGRSLEYESSIAEALKHLKVVSVKIPFAEMCVKIVPKDNVIIRRSFPRLLDYIKASAALNQVSREIDGDGDIIATGEDYDFAIGTITATTTNSKMVPIPKNQEKILDLFRDGKLNKGEPYFIEEIFAEVTWVSERSVRFFLNNLADLGFFKKETDHEGNPYKPKYKFTYIEQEKMTFPSFIELQEKCRIPAITSLASITSNTAITSKRGVIAEKGVIEVIATGSGGTKPTIVEETIE